jgi:hypothetical protein
MYWLGLVDSRTEYVELAHSYVGRERVRERDWDLEQRLGIHELDRVLNTVAETSKHRARALGRYFWSMSCVFEELAGIIEDRGILVCAIGDSVCSGVPVATTDFLSELASRHFVLENRFSYVLRNRYMQYPLRNGKGIRQENVLVFRRA